MPPAIWFWTTCQRVQNQIRHLVLKSENGGVLLLLANAAVLTLLTLIAWWLSWYDPKVMGVNDRKDLRRRGLRCAITVLLAEAAIWSLWQFIRYDNHTGGEVYLAVAVLLAIIWSRCLAALFARAFKWLIRPGDELGWQLDHSLRDLDTLARLVRAGQRKDAIQLCLKLKKSGDASVLALETIMEHLGVPQDSVRKPAPLNEASRLRQEGDFAGAETVLKSCLAKKPDDVDAAMMLIRLYAQEMQRPDKAQKVLRSLEKQSHVSSGHLEFARRSIEEWGRGTPAPEPVPVLPESVDELLAHGHYGTAVEVLERKTREQPQEFSHWLKLAEVHAVHCGAWNLAENVLKQIEADPAFNPDQIQTLRVKLMDWRKAGSRRN